MDHDEFAAFLREFAADQRECDALKRKAHEVGDKIAYDRIAAYQREARRDKRELVRLQEELFRLQEKHAETLAELKQLDEKIKQLGEEDV